MTEILGETTKQQIKSDILNYLSSNPEQFKDKTLLKALKIRAINEDAEDSVIIQQLQDKIISSSENDIIKSVSLLYLAIMVDDYQEISTLLEELDHTDIDTLLLNKLAILKNLCEILTLDDYDELIPSLENLLSQDNLPLDFEFGLLLSEFYYRDEDCEKDYLFDVVDKILEYIPDRYDTLFFKGFLKSETKQYLDALDAFYKCVEVTPAKNLAWLYLRMAEVYLALNNGKNVIEYATKAIDRFMSYNINRDDSHSDEFLPTVYSIRAQAYRIMGDLKQAQMDILKGLEYDSENEELLELKQTLVKYFGK